MADNLLRKVCKKDPEAIYRLVDGEPVIIPLRSDVEINDLGAFYILKNKTAAYIWELIDGKKSTAQIIEAVLKRFQVEAKKAKGDVESFIKELNDIKAITVVR
ncbi:MAG: PqqD family protein [Candidatus Omnitrophota bacterium]|nr:PqqD family protein [Candidatus Omnitrophota bacterium]